MSLGQQIQCRRLKNAWTLQELATRVGIARGYLHELEHDGARPSADILYRLACQFGCPMEQLLEVRPLTPTVAEITDRAICDVLIERARQDAKWGEQNHAPEIWLAILQEEVGEMATAMLRRRFGQYEHRESMELRAEAVQVTAVGLAFVQYLDRQTDTVRQPADPDGLFEPNPRLWSSESAPAQVVASAPDNSDTTPECQPALKPAPAWAYRPLTRAERLDVELEHQRPMTQAEESELARLLEAEPGEQPEPEVGTWQGHRIGALATEQANDEPE